MCIFQNPMTEQGGDGHPTDFHWAIPKVSSPERYFLSQVISSPSREVHATFGSFSRIIVYRGLHTCM